MVGHPNFNLNKEISACSCILADVIGPSFEIQGKLKERFYEKGLFVKYTHVKRYNTDETEGINEGICYVFPKIDGTNWLGETARLS